MARQMIHRHDGQTQELVHLPRTDADSRLQKRRHLRPKCHLPQLVPVPELNGPKSSICRPDMSIHIQPFLLLIFFTLDASAQDSQHNTDFDPDMLTDEGTSTG